MARRIKVLAGSLLAASVLMPTADAAAIGASLYGKVDAWDHGKGKNDYATVRDWGGKNWVKGQYSRGTTYKVKTLWNKSGKGTSTNGPKGQNIWRIKVCESLNNKPDPCSGWTNQ